MADEGAPPKNQRRQRKRVGGDASLKSKEKADLFLRLADRSWQDFSTRRSYEWKMNFALWAGLGTFAGLVLKGDVPVLPLFAWFGAATLGVIGSAYIFWWTEGMYLRNNRNQQSVHYYLDRVEDLLGAGSDEPLLAETRSPRYKHGVGPAGKYWKNWSHGTQIIVTILLVLVAVGSLFAKAYPIAGPTSTFWFTE